MALWETLYAERKRVCCTVGLSGEFEEKTEKMRAPCKTS